MNFLAGIVNATRIDAVDVPLYIYIVDDQRRLAIATGEGLFVKDQKLNGYDVRSFPPIAVAKYNDILSFLLSSAPPLDIVDGKLAVSTTSRLFITSGKLDTTLVDLNDGGLQALETDLSLEKPLNAMQCLFEHEGTWRW
uniref:VP7 n=1 Tax=Grass carp reovirus TaxID=128987 RepID=A0A0C5Q4K6_GCRV|nr:VP7 [Grass carp reovirus]